MQGLGVPEKAGSSPTRTPAAHPPAPPADRLRVRLLRGEGCWGAVLRGLRDLPVPRWARRSLPQLRCASRRLRPAPQGSAAQRHGLDQFHSLPRLLPRGQIVHCPRPLHAGLPTSPTMAARRHTRTAAGAQSSLPPSIGRLTARHGQAGTAQPEPTLDARLVLTQTCHYMFKQRER